MHAYDESPAVQPLRTQSAQLILMRGLGLLWMFDAILQMQPGMFTMDMISTIMQPAATGQPPWLTGLIDWSIRVVTPHLALFNWTIVAVQFVIGAMLLWPNARRYTVGLWISLVWSLLIWLFGEGLGQLLTGSASLLTGAPGSALLYALASMLLLAPPGWARGWRLPLDPATIMVAITLIVGGMLQLSPLFWTPLGLSAPFGSAAMMPQPLFMRQSIDVLANLAATAPLPVNAVALLAPIGLGLLLIAGPYRRWVLWVALLWIAATWWFGQDLGMLASGMATDPNSAPVLALLLVAGWSARQAPVHATSGLSA